MPKIVDHDARRRVLARAIVHVAAREGLENASLRAVGKEAGLAMGTVQHYFADREAMLDFVLGYVQEQRTSRIRRAVEGLPEPRPRALLDVIVDEVLAADEANLTFERVHLMFVARAQGHRPTAKRLAQGRAVVVGLMTQLLRDGGLRDGVAPSEAAEVLWALLDSLPVSITLGQHTAESARVLVRSYLAGITAEGTR